MFIFASAVTLLLTIIVMVFVAYKTKRPVSYLTGFVAGLVTYVVLVLVEVGLLQGITPANHFRFSVHQQEIWFLAAGYSLAFLFSSMVLSRAFEIDKGCASNYVPNIRPYVILGLVLFLIYFIMFGKDIVTAADYVEGAAIRYESVAFSSASALVLYYLIFISSLLIAKGKYSFAGFVSFFVVLGGFWTSDKNPMVLGLVSLVYVGLTSGYRIRLWKLGAALVVGIGFLLFIPGFSVYRAGGVGLLEAAQIGLSRLTLTRMDPAGPYGSIIDVLSGGRVGVGYLESAQVLIPRAILPFERGLDPAEDYAQRTMLNWQPGRGLGFSPLAEGYLNAGFLGPFVHAPLFLASWLGCWLLVRRIFALAKLNEVFPHFFCVMGFYLMMLSFRTSMVGSVKAVLLQMVGLAAVLFLARVIGSLLTRVQA